MLQIFTLPQWLDNLIFHQLKGKHSPDYVRFEYNLNLNKQEVLTYLGTYFPRSYIETRELFTDFFVNTDYLDLLSGDDSLNILDLGCGTGGEIFGLLSVIEEYLPNIRTVKIVAIDGNQEALRVFEQVMAEYKKHSALDIGYTLGPIFIENEEDLHLITDIIQGSFRLILSCKAICEMITKKRIQSKAYKYIANLLAAKLDPMGVLFIEDVTIPNSSTGKFLPYMLNSELNEFIRENPKLATIFPTTCAEHGEDCIDGCFFKREFKLAHSAKKEDLTKIVYRFIGGKHLLKQLHIKPSVLNTVITCNQQ